MYQSNYNTFKYMSGVYRRQVKWILYTPRNLSYRASPKHYTL